MATLAAVRRAAIKIGATITDEKIGDSHTCSVEAPTGMIWAIGDLHEIVDSSYRPWKPDYSDLLQRMSHGVKPCPYGEKCEWCNDQTV